MVDNEEQVLNTGVKRTRQCSICRVPPDKRGELSRTWKYHTPEYTQAKLDRQKENPDEEDKDMRIHHVSNWTWNHKFCNVHKLVDVSILHQLFKGIFIRLIIWCVLLVEDVISNGRSKGTVKRKKKGKSVLELAASIQLDERFRQIPSHTRLKHFRHFSKVQQWSGVEQKAIVRQLVPAIAPLLIGKRDAAIHYARAVMNSVFLAKHVSHDENTLSYMEHSLYRLNCLKTVFSKYRPQNTTDDAENEDEGLFNIPKLHVMTHYVAFIRLYIRQCRGF